MAPRGRSGGRLVGLLLVALAGVLTAYLATRFEGQRPVIFMLPGPVHVGNEQGVEVQVHDDGTGLQNVRVWLELENGTEIPLELQSFPGNLLLGADLRIDRDLAITIRPKELDLADGEVMLKVEARDYSWRGNIGVAQVSLWIDTAPPTISVSTGLSYVRRGGTELAVYRLNERAVKHGVEVGESFFPGYSHPSDPEQFVALYAFAPGLPPETQARVIAVDRAQNRSGVPLATSIVERSFPSDRVNLSEQFLSRKVPELLPDHDGDLLEGYLRINRDLRSQDAEKIRKICSRSSDERLWTEPFLQLPGSQVNARFAEQRSYVYDGRVVDRQVHLGFDLASSARAPVPSANDGVVVFAGPLGIYGNTVIVDHGLGLFSLYGHLSEITVKKGRPIARAEALGRTGETGLAGGDHLHFSMLVNGDFVDPLEWFDGRWIREHLEVKLAPPPEEST